MVLTIGLDLILRAALPGIDSRTASLWIAIAVAVLLAFAVSLAGWWREVGYTPVSQWRELHWLTVPALITLVPLVAGIRPLDGNTYTVLIAGYALTGFVEETMFRGVLINLLRDRSPLVIASATALLFGVVHLSNIVIRGEVVIIVAQAVGAAAFGFGFAALRLRTNTLLPLVLLHAAHDLFLQMGTLPLIPVAVAQDVLLFAFGLWLLRTWRPSTS
jgi:membrane protease YdiL (CAAX protease family)